MKTYEKIKECVNAVRQNRSPIVIADKFALNPGNSADRISLKLWDGETFGDEVILIANANNKYNKYIRSIVNYIWQELPDKYKTPPETPQEKEVRLLKEEIARLWVTISEERKKYELEEDKYSKCNICGSKTLKENTHQCGRQVRFLYQ